MRKKEFGNNNKYSKNGFETMDVDYKNPLIHFGKKIGYFIMDSIIAYIFLILLLLSVLYIGWNPSKVYWNVALRSNRFNEKIFINCIGYGVTGDHRIIKISKQKDSSFKKKENEYFLEGLFNVWYRFQNDSLYICSEANFSKPIKNNIKSPIVFNCENGLNLYDDKTMRTYGYHQIR